MSQRVYLPLTGADLATLVARGRLPGPRPAYAVTSALRDAWPEADEESWEYAALMAAAVVSRSADGRRRVIAADVAHIEPAPPGDPGDDPGDDSGDDPTRVLVPGDVAITGVAAAHVDTAPGAGDDDDLAWYATQELAALVAATP